MVSRDEGQLTYRDRRKLTFYFKADRRVDFRELTKENFRVFKSRIWMSMVARDGRHSQFVTVVRADMSRSAMSSSI
jgi:cell fate regulator YaaT (PSP1 superfamily)